VSIVWGVNLRDEVSPPANAAAKAMGDAAQQAKVLASAMKAAQAATTKAAALGDAAGVRRAAANYHVLSESFHALPPGAREATEKTHELGESMFASVFKAELLKDAVEELGKKAFEVLKSGFELAIDASENLKRMTAQFDALSAAGGVSGKATVAAIREIAKEVPQSEAQVAAWSRSLMATGTIRLDKLKEQIKAIASADALGAVEGAGEAVRGILSKLNETAERGSKTKFTLAKLAPTGLSERDFLNAIGMTAGNFEAAKKAGTVTGLQISDAIVKALNLKGKSALEAQMDELSTLATKAKDAFTKLFEDVDITPFTDGLKSFFNIFDLARPSGQAMKAGITATFNEIFKIAGKVFELMRHGFFVIGSVVLQTMLFLRPFVRQFKEWFAAHDGMNIMITALKGVGIVVGILAGFFGGLVLSGLAVGAMFTALGTAVALAIGYVVGLVPRAGEALGDMAFKAVQAGTDFVNGLVDGIKNGIGRAVAAAKEMGTSVLNSITGMFQSHSPSLVMRGIGMGLPGGLAAGIHGGTGQAVAASVHMSEAVVRPVETVRVGASAPPRTAAPSGEGGGRGGGSVNLTIENFSINAGHTGTPQELRQIVEEEFTSLGERLALMIGSAPEPA